MCLSPNEIINQYTGASVRKAQSSSAMIIGKSILAGMMIALGAACSSVAVHAIDNVGLARFVAGLVFPVGLMMVVLMGTELFTGDCLMVIGVCDRKVSGLQMVKTLILVYVGNFIGSIILAGLICTSGQLDYSGGRLGAYTIKVALGKVACGPGQKISSGILCNILVCLAVLMAMAAKDVTGKLMSCFFVIMIFVTGGFEHCVANMYYITAGMMAKLSTAYTDAAASIYNITDVSSLNIGNMLVHNLLPVTIGNLIGGIVCVGMPLYFLNHDRKSER